MHNFLNTITEPIRNHNVLCTRSIVCSTVSVISHCLLLAVLLASCTSTKSPTQTSANSTPSAHPGASIAANPNPVPSGPGGGKTTINWDTGDSSTGQVYMSENNGPEVLFTGESPKGSQDVDWIGTGKTYEFRLYAGTEHKRQLAAVRVERSKEV